jgi:hypothetical protein
MATRESRITVATGEKGCGKSYTTLWEIIVPYAKGMLNGGIPRKVLIYDAQNEYQFTSNPNNNIYPKTDKHKKLTGGKPLEIKMIDVNDVARFSKQQRVEIRRVSPFYSQTTYDKKGNMLTKKGNMMSNKDKVKALIQTVQNFNNGLLLIEDLRSLFANTIPHDIIDLIVSNRHKNMDIVWHLQSVGRMLPEFWENVNMLRFHKEKGSIDYHETKLQEKYSLFKICANLVKGQVDKGSERFYVWINLDRKKIIGNFTETEFLEACEKYIKQSPSSMRSLEYEKDDNGKAKYTYTQCVDMVKQELFKDYFGNI